MKGLELEVVWGIIIAIACVLLFLSLVTGTFRSAANWVYCDIYIKVLNFFHGSEMASIPDACRNEATYSEQVVISDTDNRIVSRELLSYIIACWGNAETMGLYESHPCYEVTISNSVNNVSEENVSFILIKEDHCKSIENSDYGCGERNQIIWSVDGQVTSLIGKNVSDAINQFTIPNPIPVDESMIPVVDNIKTKLELKNFIVGDVPDSICRSKGCSQWEYNKSTGYVSLNISSATYKYNIDSVMSYLEINGLVNSTIRDQKILLIEYQGTKDAVEVLG